MGTLLQCLWECKLIQSLWRTMWKFLKKLKTELPYDLAIPLLGTYSEKTIIQKDTCTQMLIAALFTIARMWKQSKFPSTEEWTNEILFSHKKEWNCVICRDVYRPRDYHIKSNKSEREKQVSYNITYMWNLGKWYRWTYVQSGNRDTDTENKLMDTKGEEEVGWIGR